MVFKGGTAIHHCYLKQSRLSEDLDFSCVDPRITMKEVTTALSADFLEIKDEHISKATFKINRLKYHGPLGLPNSLKIEIDFLQNVVLPPKEIVFQNAWKVEVKVVVMDEREVCAEKIRAMSDRSRYRDFYDLYFLLDRFSFNMQDIITLIKQKEIRKPISKKSILANLKNSLMAKEKELARVYYMHEIPEEKLIKMIQDLPIIGEIKPEKQHNSSH